MKFLTTITACPLDKCTKFCWIFILIRMLSCPDTRNLGSSFEKRTVHCTVNEEHRSRLSSIKSFLLKYPWLLMTILSDRARAVQQALPTEEQNSSTWKNGIWNRNKCFVSLHIKSLTRPTWSVVDFCVRSSLAFPIYAGNGDHRVGWHFLSNTGIVIYGEET